MDQLVLDLRQTVRRLASRPAFVALAIATLGIGIGAPTTIFSVLDAVVLRPLPYPEPERLVFLFETTPQGGDFSTSEPNFLDFRRRNQSFVDLAAYRSDQLALVPPDGEPMRLSATLVTASFFDILGARPAAGRTLLAEDDLPDGEQTVAVLSHGLWQRSFGGDPAIVGTAVSLSGRPHQVVGVLEPDFDYPGDVDVWVPLRPRADANRANHQLDWIGRLRPGVSRDQAQADLATIATDLGQTYPESNRDWSVRCVSLRDAVVGPDLDRRMTVLLGAVGLLLMIACVNVSNLLLAQGLERRAELAVRSAMGASRAHLLRQLVGEGLCLAAAGAGLGLLLTSWAIPLVQTLNPGGVARLDEAVVDTRVFAFAAIVALASGVLFALLPALTVLSGNLVDSLRQGSRRLASGGRLREALVVVELALAMTLLLGATLLGRSFLHLLDTDLGIDTERVVAVPLALTAAHHDPETRLVFLRQLSDRLRALPGIERVSATNILPIGSGSTIMGVAVEGRDSTALGEGPAADWRAVRPGIFETLGVPILRGRRFQDSDLDAAQPIVVISAGLAERLLPGEDPIGQRLALWEDPERIHTVVGVAGDLNDTRLDGGPRLTVYFLDRGFWPWVTLLVRTPSDLAAISGPLRRVIRDVDPTLPVPSIETLEERRALAATPQRFTTAMMGAFSLTAAMLAAIGVYGLLSFLVASRAREIGIRLALGARQASVLGLILGRTMRLALGGIGLGIATALALHRTLESLLFETAPTDPTLYVSVATALVAVALLASLVPARRASRLSPVLALNSD